MEINFVKSSFSELEDFVDTYAKSLNSPIDSFLEEHILNSEHFCITVDDRKIGYFSIYNRELLTQFYLDKPYMHLGQDVFFKVKKMQSLQSAYVSTSDEFFLSHALDNYIRLEKQAYFFQDSEIPIKNEKIQTEIMIRLAREDDIESIIRNSGDFFDKLDERVPKEQIFIAFKDDVEVGYGILEKGVIMKGYVSIGMYTNEEYRQQGIGKNILLKLKEQAYQNNMKPVAGCWYFNHNSKKTLESAGMYSNTRLLKIYF